jgi:biopolymer transport protein ExbD/biopolymer transport protein TolR
VAKRGLGRSNVNADINVTPMADIMLVLLIIFMITTPLLQTGITVNLPKARNPLDAPEADAEDAVVVALTREGRVYLQKTQITEEDLLREIQEKFTGDVNRTLFLRADSAVAYGRVVQLVNECRKSGVERIGLMAEKERE